VLPLDHKKQMK